MGIEAVSRKDASMYQGSTGAQAAEKVAEVQPQAVARESGMSDRKNSNIKEEKTDKTKNGNAYGDSEQLKNAVSDLNKKMGNSEAVFGIHEKTNRVTIKIVDKESKKVMKEYPAEETLDMIAKVWEAAGLMLDEKR